LEVSPDAYGIEPHEQPKRKRQARPKPSPSATASCARFEPPPSQLGAPSHSSVCCMTPASPSSHRMIDSSLCMMDSAVDGAAMSELVLVLEQAKVVPDCSRRLFAAAMIR